MNLTPDDIKMLAKAIADSAPPISPNAEQANLTLGIIVAIGTIIGFLIAVIVFIAKVGALGQRIDNRLTENTDDIKRAHDKIREINPKIEAHSLELAVMARDIEHLQGAS